MLDVPRARRAVLYAEAVERAASVGDVARAAALAPKAAPRAATALCVAACLGEWRAADALDHLDHLAASRPTRVFANDTANTTRITRTDASVSSRDTHNNTHEEAWLRLCCAAHLELSAWAASAAAAAIGAAGEIAEDVPDASATFPWPSGALSPPLAADAAEALARSRRPRKGAHRSLGPVSGGARGEARRRRRRRDHRAPRAAQSAPARRRPAARLDAMVAPARRSASAADTFSAAASAAALRGGCRADQIFRFARGGGGGGRRRRGRSPRRRRARAAAAGGGRGRGRGAALFGPERDARSDSSAIIAVLPDAPRETRRRGFGVGPGRGGDPRRRAPAAHGRARPSRRGGGSGAWR